MILSLKGLILPRFFLSKWMPCQSHMFICVRFLIITVHVYISSCTIVFCLLLSFVYSILYVYTSLFLLGMYRRSGWLDIWPFFTIRFRHWNRIVAWNSRIILPDTVYILKVWSFTLQSAKSCRAPAYQLRSHGKYAKCASRGDAKLTVAKIETN